MQDSRSSGEGGMCMDIWIYVCGAGDEAAGASVGRLVADLTRIACCSAGEPESAGYEGAQVCTIQSDSAAVERCCGGRCSRSTLSGACTQGRETGREQDERKDEASIATKALMSTCECA